jgi:hypothetical protein
MRTFMAMLVAMAISAWALAAAPDQDAGIVHQQVEPGIVAGDPLGKGAHRGERSEIGRIELRRTNPRGVDFLDELGPAFGIAAMDDDVRAARGESAALPAWLNSASSRAQAAGAHAEIAIATSMAMNVRIVRLPALPGS